LKIFFSSLFSPACSTWPTVGGPVQCISPFGPLFPLPRSAQPPLPSPPSRFPGLGPLLGGPVPSPFPRWPARQPAPLGLPRACRSAPAQSRAPPSRLSARARSLAWWTALLRPSPARAVRSPFTHCAGGPPVSALVSLSFLLPRVSFLPRRFPSPVVGHARKAIARIRKVTHPACSPSFFPSPSGL